MPGNCTITVKNNMKVVGFIHAKGNSERVSNKNLKLLNGKPLFTYAIEIAQHANCIDEVVIDSDSDEILRLGEKLGATPLKRPKKLASNKTTGDDLAFWQASNYSDSDFIVQVVPTSPFLKSLTIDNAFKTLSKSNYDSIVAVHEEFFYFWNKGKPDYFNSDGSIPNSNTLKSAVFETTGLYMSRTNYVLSEKKRMNPENSLPIFVSKLESVDINYPEDFEFAEILMRGISA